MKLVFDIGTRATESDAFDAGYDAALNRPNLNNCHFTLFRSRELTRAWERGNAVGHETRLKQMG